MERHGARLPGAAPPGIRCGHHFARETEASYTPGLPTATSSAAVPAPGGTYRAAAVYEGIVPPAVLGTVSWWRLGEAGLVRLDQSFLAPDTEVHGVGAVETAATSRLGALAGAHNRTHFMLPLADQSLSMEPA